jgi:hypothetical protein
MKVKSWIRIRITVKSWIRIRITVKSWIRIRIKVKSRIRIRIKVTRIHNPGSKRKWAFSGWQHGRPF